MKEQPADFYDQMTQAADETDGAGRLREAYDAARRHVETRARELPPEERDAFVSQIMSTIEETLYGPKDTLSTAVRCAMHGDGNG